MAAKGKKQRKSLRRGRRPIAAALALLCLFFVGSGLWMHANAKITRVERAEVYLPDLPAAFEGARVLFISDLDIRTQGDLRACKNLMKTLQALKPDILLLGGDYSADTLMDVLNNQPNAEGGALAAEFLRSLVDFSAPMGKFAVAGENDTDLALLESACASGGVEYLSDRCAVIQKDGAQLVVAGLSEVTLKQTQYASLGSAFSGDECVIALAHNPYAYVGVRVAEAKNGGAWADLVLTGHNLGGQINLFGKSVRAMSDEEARTVSGWFYPNDLPLLVSEGLGCKGPMLRLGSRSEVHLLTLHRQQVQQIHLPILE